MTDREDQQAMDVVERAAAALRDARVPPGPSPTIVASTVEALRALDNPPDVVRHNARREIMFRIGRYSGVAVAASLLVVAGWFWFRGNGSGTAFADMIEKVKKAESVSFVWTDDPAGGAICTIRIQGNDFRGDVVGTGKHLGVGPLRSVIFDVTRNEWATLDHKDKTFLRDSSSFYRDWQKTISGLVDCLRDLKPEDGKLIGHEQEEGRKLQVYEVKRADLLAPRIPGYVAAKVWVDETTRLPVRVRAHCVVKPGDEGVTVVKELVWNQPIDPKVFKIEVPEGYRVIEKSGQPNLFSGNKIGIPFADMIEKAREAKSFSYEIVNEPLGTTKSPGWEKSVMKVYFKEPGLLREERPGGDVMIQNITAGKTLRYDPSTKKAKLFPFKPQASWLPFRKFFLDEGRKWADGAEQRLGEREVDGKKAQGFAVRGDANTLWNIWADAETGKLLRLEYVTRDWKTITSKIVLNPDLPDSLFSVEPPEGYELTVWKDNASGSGEMTAEQRRALELEKKAAKEAAEAAKRQAEQRRAAPVNKDKKAGSQK